MKIDGKKIACELRSLRIKNGLNAEEVCNNVGINRTSLYKYEKDASDIKWKTLEKMLTFYNVDPVIFFKLISEYFRY